MTDQQHFPGIEPGREPSPEMTHRVELDPALRELLRLSVRESVEYDMGALSDEARARHNALCMGVDPRQRRLFGG